MHWGKEDLSLSVAKISPNHKMSVILSLAKQFASALSFCACLL